MAEKKKEVKPLSDAEKTRLFIDMGTDRVNAAVKAIKRLAPLADKRRFLYSNDQIQKIANALGEAWVKVSKEFAGEKKIGDFHF